MVTADIEIIFQNELILVINKPSGLSVTTDRSGSFFLRDSLEKILPAKTVENLRLIHRLDKDTSGVMILAKTKEAQTVFSQAFENRNVRKTYLALVSGFPPAERGIIDTPISAEPTGKNIFRIDYKRGKDARTEWRLLANFGHISLLAVNPLTGRTHQIRIHLPSIGLELAVDPLYGNSKGLLLSEFKSRYKLGKFEEEKPLIDRLTLHAYQLEFPNPPSDCPGLFIAALDKKFKACIKMLTKYNPKGPEAFINPEIYEKILSAYRID
jgi:23S rRNA pseudouridine1911/1915/1917 synthase